MDSKRGRRQLREIRRAKRDVADVGACAGGTESDVGGKVVENGGLSEAGGRERRGSEEEGGAERSGQVYSALLTLLEAEGRGARVQKRRKVSGDETVEEEEDARERYEAEVTSGLASDGGEDAEEQDEGTGSEGEDEADERDEFQLHFNEASEEMLEQLSAAHAQGTVRYRTQKVAVDGGDEVLAFSRPVVGAHGDADRLQVEGNMHAYFIKQKLRMENGLMEKSGPPLNALQRKLVDPMFQYRDLLYEYGDYAEEPLYRQLYVLHLLNHVYKTRDHILKNNEKLHDNPDLSLLDQGFTRPKVLIVVPTRDAAFSVVDQIIKSSGLEQVDKKAKFKDQFFDDSLPPSLKPKSFQHIFKGNTNDFFVLGLKFTRKTLKLYSNFYQSDVIICSPLGIQLILENTDKKKRQNDFISSIEMLVVDQLHSIEFQNISHLLSVFQHINKIPEKSHDADFSRIRMWYINDQARFLRQTMIFTRYVSPFANSLLHSKCCNYAGRVKNKRTIGPESCAVNQLGLRVRQIFQRFDFGKLAVDEPDNRFKFFTSTVLSSITKSTGYSDGILVYIPDYTDYIRVRNYFKERTSLPFGELNEYSDQRSLTSQRHLFQKGKLKVLLYTERLHHFRRYEIKGVKSVVFYKPPLNPEFYQEVVRFIAKNAYLGASDINISTVRCLYSKADSLALERIVGTKRAAVLACGLNETYEIK